MLLLDQDGARRERRPSHLPSERRRAGGPSPGGEPRHWTGFHPQRDPSARGRNHAAGPTLASSDDRIAAVAPSRWSPHQRWSRLGDRLCLYSMHPPSTTMTKPWRSCGPSWCCRKATQGCSAESAGRPCHVGCPASRQAAVFRHSSDPRCRRLDHDSHAVVGHRPCREIPMIATALITLPLVRAVVLSLLALAPRRLRPHGEPQEHHVRCC